MQDKWKKYLLIFGFTICFSHFFLVSSYLIKPVFFSSFYTYPFFQQSWNLFVPAPDCNYSLIIIDKDLQPDPFDLFEEILIKHQTNRLGGYEMVLTSLTNSIHYFEKEAEAKNFGGGKVTQNEYFFIIEKFVKNYLQYSKKIKITNRLKIILIVKPITGKKQRIYFN